MSTKTSNNPLLPLLCLRELVAFPGVTLPLFVGRAKSVLAIEEAMKSGEIMLAAQINPATSDPSPDDIYQIGVVAVISQTIKTADGPIKVLVTGVRRAKITRCLFENEYLMVEVEELDESAEREIIPETLISDVASELQTYLELLRPDPEYPHAEVIADIKKIEGVGLLSDGIAGRIKADAALLQPLLEQLDPKLRLHETREVLKGAIENLKSRTIQEPSQAPHAQSPEDSEAEFEALLNDTYEARDASFSVFGSRDPQVIAPIMNPGLTGGPRWPALRQALAIYHRQNSTVVVSDGLSDPFDDGRSGPGCGLEIFIEVDEKFDSSDRHWSIGLLYELSQEIAYKHEAFLASLDGGSDHLISFELPGVAVPDQWKNQNGNVGLLLGLPAPGIPSKFLVPCGEVQLVSVKLLTLQELNLILDQGGVARKALAEAFSRSGENHLSSLKRPSVK
jgi:Lon protease-like protein